MPSSGLYGTLGSETGFAFRERLSPWQATRTGVIMCHGAGGSPTEEQDPAGGGPFASAIVEAGYPLVSMDMGGQYTWGSSLATSKAANAVTQVEAIGAKTTGKIWIGTSMGTEAVLCSILSAAVSTSQVKAVGLMLPLPSLVDMHDNNRGGYASTMETAWGIPGPATGNTHTSTTIDNLSINTSTLTTGVSVVGSGIPTGATIVTKPTSSSITISSATTSSLTGTSITFNWAGNSTIAAGDPNQHPSSFTGFPIKMWYGTSDVIAIPSVVTGFASAVNSAGGNVTTQSANVGHAWNVATAQNIRDFVVANA